MEKTTAVAAHARNFVEALGVKPEMIVQERGWDEDTDDALREAIETVIGEEMEDEDSDEVIDIVLLWWRDGDGDLVDELVDAIGLLAEDGSIWVLSPKTGRDGYVEPSDISEAAPTAGLNQTSVATLGEWAGSRLVQRR